MIVRGTIFRHPAFTFKNGTTGTKLLILLNTPAKQEPYLLVKTTSQQKDKPRTPGCIKAESLFFIPARKTYFPLDTWVQLFELYEVVDAHKDSNFKITGSLGSGMVDRIIKCLFASQVEDLTPHHKKLLKQPLGDSLQKLKEHFRRRRN